jgi:hypothetical protein
MNTPKNFRNLIGQTFGQLTVAGRAPNGANWRVYWQCQCSCGQQANVRSDALLGIKPNTAVGRILRQGWSPILACTTPTRR